MSGYDRTINYNYDWQLAAEYLDEQLGREATDEEIQEFLDEQEARAIDAWESQKEDWDNETRD
jgi:hypothetical protein